MVKDTTEKMTAENANKKLAGFLYEVGTLRKIQRTHTQVLLSGDESDNIASHSYRATMIGLLLAKREGADSHKVVLMCLFHDLPETRSGDQNWIHKKYVKVFEDEIRKRQLAGLQESPELMEVVKEYEERKTKEAIIAKDADILEQILLLREYAWAGNHEAAGWLGKRPTEHNQQYKLLKTTTAKRLAREIFRQKPSAWWKTIWTEKRR